MRCARTAGPRALALLAGLLCICPSASCAEPTPTEAPSVRVYDVPREAAASLSAEKLSRRRGWRAVGQGDMAHRFRGCAVLTNDRLAVVLHADSPDVDLYSRRAGKPALCARLRPIRSDGEAPTRASLSVQGGAAGGVSIQAAFPSAGAKGCHVVYTLGVGKAFLQTTASAGVARLRVLAPCRFAVLPDFFADDIVVDAAALPAGTAALPGENFLLHMIPGGGAVVMTVSEARGSDIGVAVSKSAPRRIERSDVSYGGKPNVWVAVLAEKGIWHERRVRPADAGKVLPLAWRAPFAALWRVDWTAADKLTDSWQMLLQHPEGKYVMQGWFGGDPSAGQSFGPEFGPRDWNKPGRKRWNPVLGSFDYPCWIDRAGRGYLQPLTSRRYVERGEVCNFDGPAIVYPLDRARAAPFRTPLDKLTVVDLVRETLGVGPCEYILDLEGQKRNSRGVATCYARDVIHAIYKEGSQLRQGPEIEKHLAAAVAFIRNVRERIDEYVAFGKQTEAYLVEQKRLHPQHAEFLDELLRVTKRLDQFYESSRQAIHTPEYAERAAAEFRRELLTYTGDDAYKKCAERMKVFTGIGGRQDGLVASCRMIVKVLRQRCGLAMATNPGVKALAAEVRARTQKVLRNPTAYEAPQH